MILNYESQFSAKGGSAVGGKIYERIGLGSRGAKSGGRRIRTPERISPQLVFLDPVRKRWG
ncbi:MAG: hypothetical protein CO002_03745 [Candidatus Portnoybacteria bacterium CG_4_8_14_3_um_filter_44_10]|uniref:Uncharacterized protein n=1 Tax=Candidatus Portnoybacteria bacterium CG_4_8_14_3_um_filter_44_10 TaxID=1974802 RepID=A0A2M7IF67_9BACT|nr:MAG: hypothetical protein CO002_03745 [Candidatus Portnoybacteria bacterium CG_4_8_14_3_um_filter_44_10]